MIALAPARPISFREPHRMKIQTDDSRRAWRRREWLAAAPGVVALSAWPFAPSAATAAPAELGQLVQWPQVALLGGGSFGPAQAAGQAVVVVFWSTTCPFCRRHNQHVEKLQRAIEGRALSILTVARDRDPARVQQYAQQQGYSFPITMDSEPLAQALSVRKVIPLTVTVDRQGRLKQAAAGEMFEEDVMALLQLAAPATRETAPKAAPR